MQQIDIKFTNLKTHRIRRVVIKQVSEKYAKEWFAQVVAAELQRVLTSKKFLRSVK